MAGAASAWRAASGPRGERVPAQALAQIRPGAVGALLYHAAIPITEFAPSWPSGVRLQVHVMESDNLGDIGRALTRDVDGAELFLYPGSGHLFADPGLPDYDPKAARLLLDRTLTFLSH